MSDTQTTQNTGYDRESISLPKVAFFSLATILLLTVIAIGGRTIYIMAKERVYKEQVMEAPAPYLDDLRERENKILNSYGIMDTTAQRYRVPIDVAMERLAAENR